MRRRSTIAWTATAVTLIAVVIVVGRTALPDLRLARSLSLTNSATTVAMRGPNGAFSESARQRVTASLARTGNTAFLDHYLAAMELFATGPLLTGNRVRLLVDGPATYRAMFRAIEQAQHYVLLETFILEDATTDASSLAQVLRAAIARGVAVYLLYDDVGSLTTGEEFLRSLGTTAVVACVFNPIDPLDERFAGFNERDHRKIVVVDGVVAFAGGINFSRTYRKASRDVRRARQRVVDDGWRDTHLELAGPVVAALQEHFWQAWHSQECEGDTASSPARAAAEAGGTLLRVVASTPEDEFNEVYASILAAVTHARQNIDITMAYFVPDDVLENALREAAERGVRVRMIVPSYSDFTGVFYAGRAHYADLLASGVRLFELDGALLHSKTMVVDDIWSSVGSTNFDWRSFVHNSEININVIDAGFAAQMTALFARDLADSTEITREAWDDRPLIDRALEWFWLPMQFYL